MTDLLKDEQFLKLEKEFKFLSRARSHHGELEKLSYVVFDIETTGLNPETDEIIEIGAIKLENKELKDIFNKLVRPVKSVPQNITELTGITQEMLNDEMPIKPVISQFSNYIGSSVLVAHNADFDISFIKNNLKKSLNKDLNNTVVCTVLVARDLLPNLENHKLPTVAKYFGLEMANRHRAIGDCELTFQIWLKFIDKLKGKNIISKTDLENYMSSLYKVRAGAA
jgi:DNA polymerase-3 subunit alpha (Gram-positive type)